MLNEILNNPYRILGVFSNTPKKEQLANKAKMQAFLRVGKSMPFKQDMKGILPEINRTQELIDLAESELTLVAGQVKHAQFWFISQTPLDKVAFNHLYSGKIDSAMDIWKKARNASSLQNLLVCYLIKGDYKTAILKCAIPLYEEYGDEFVLSIDYNASIPTSELVDNFIDVLLKEEVDLASLSKEIKNEVWSKSIRQKTVAPLLHQIDALISKAKEERKKGPQACFAAGTKLKANSRKSLDSLRNMLPADDSQYKIEADKLAQEILQCAIDYYNDTEDSDAPRKSLPLMEYALSIAVGETAKQRCKQNAETIRKDAEALPPAEVAAEVAEIQKILAKYRDMPKTCESALWLLKEVRASLVEIKEKVGASDKFYLKLSSTIGNAALNYLIDDVNRSIKDYEDYTTAHDVFKTGPYLDINARQKEGVVRNTLKAAWQTMLKLDLLDKDASFKKRYEDNNIILGKLIRDFNGSYIPDYDYVRRDRGYGYGNSTNSYQSNSESNKKRSKSKKKIAEGNHKWWIIAASVIPVIVLAGVGLIWGFSGYAGLMVIIAIISFLVIYEAFISSEASGCLIPIVVIGVVCIFFGIYASVQEQKTKGQKAYETLKENPTAEKCETFLSEYSGTIYENDVLRMYYYCVVGRGNIYSLKKFAEKYSSTTWGKTARESVQQICDSLYQIAASKNTQEAWREYQAHVPIAYYSDSEDKIDSLKNDVWSTDSKAWTQACKENTIAAYEKYIAMYPHGRNSAMANKRIIDLEVDSLYAGDYIDLPSMEQSGYGGGTSSRLKIENNTSRTLTLLYSGPDSKQIVISPHQSKSASLKNGTYRIVASVDDPSIRNFAGSETLRGGNYSASYYISFK